MYNLIKFEFYKLKHNRVFKNSLILISLCVAYTIYLFFFKEHTYKVFNSAFGGREYGFWLNNFNNRGNPKAIEFVHSALGFVPIFELLIMFIAGEFIIKEYSYGTLKNILSYGHKREQVYISKIIIMLVATFILTFLLLFGTVIVAFISGAIKKVSYDEILGAINFILLICIVFTAIASIYTFLCTLIKSKSLIVAIGLIYIFVSSIFIGKIPYQKYTPTFMLMDIGIVPPTVQNIHHIIMTCIILIIVTSFLGIYVFKKEDIS
ncbi:ABC-2 transporter family protein [Clostridium sporogenes]|uniref:ABC transporter permease n=1 Tax=Clostridium TaxID=1485 RepID=UPI000909A7F7|nr:MULTISPECIES: ABC transporter permease subunit [Clostridium]APF25560.1 ABC-2 transporter family protein [Clostridium sporogenes]MDI6918123.1 ABC transporter permease [Clostridium botulinum]WMU98476.1 ABC transporter permease [Clostridium botulinum]